MRNILLWLDFPLPKEWYEEFWPEPGDEDWPEWDGSLPLLPDDGNGYGGKKKNAPDFEKL